MKGKRPKLTIVSGPSDKKVVALANKTVTIGRDLDNDLVISGEAVSRHHAEIAWTRRQYFLTDLGSRNGTFVNESRLEPHKPHSLCHKDRIQIAGNIATLQFDDPQATKTVQIKAIMHGGLRLDPERREVWVQDQLLSPPLSPQQFDFLFRLFEKPGKVCGRDEIATCVWRDAKAETVSEEMIDAVASRVRKRIRALDPTREYIITVRGYGFKLVTNK